MHICSLYSRSYKLTSNFQCRNLLPSYTKFDSNTESDIPLKFYKASIIAFHLAIYERTISIHNKFSVLDATWNGTGFHNVNEIGGQNISLNRQEGAGISHKFIFKKLQWSARRIKSTIKLPFYHIEKYLSLYLPHVHPFQLFQGIANLIQIPWRIQYLFILGVAHHLHLPLCYFSLPYFCTPLPFILRPLKSLLLFFVALLLKN